MVLACIPHLCDCIPLSDVPSERGLCGEKSLQKRFFSAKQSKAFANLFWRDFSPQSSQKPSLLTMQSHIQHSRRNAFYIVHKKHYACTPGARVSPFLSKFSRGLIRIIGVSSLPCPDGLSLTNFISSSSGICFLKSSEAPRSS